MTNLLEASKVIGRDKRACPVLQLHDLGTAPQAAKRLTRCPNVYPHKPPSTNLTLSGIFNDEDGQSSRALGSENQDYSRHGILGPAFGPP